MKIKHTKGAGLALHSIHQEARSSSGSMVSGTSQPLSVPTEKEHDVNTLDRRFHRSQSTLQWSSEVI